MMYYANALHANNTFYAAAAGAVVASLTAHTLPFVGMSHKVCFRVRSV